MLDFVKIEPRFFLVAHAPVKPGVLEVPLEIPVGRFSSENQQAAGNGAGEPKRTRFGRG